MSVAVEISNPDKALFPDGLTKAELARYYERIAETMLPHVRGRPVHMQRFPDGIEGQEIQQKQAPDYFPDFVERARVKRKRGGSIEHVLVENAETLVYLADQACITPHVWLSRIEELDHPDQLIFDLDPPGRDLSPVRDAARALRQLLEEIGLAAYLKSTGSRGLHVVSPLDRRAAFDEVRFFARELATLLADREPKRYTVEQRKEKRRGRLYLDTARNAYAQTAVAPYAVRALPGAPVACPLEWRELGRVRPQQFTVRNIARRLARKDDPWAEIDGAARSRRGPSPSRAGLRRRKLADATWAQRVRVLNESGYAPTTRGPHACSATPARSCSSATAATCADCAPRRPATRSGSGRC
jgi:bifunctional non-homologous end joining protein LigD